MADIIMSGTCCSVSHFGLIAAYGDLFSVKVIFFYSVFLVVSDRELEPNNNNMSSRVDDPKNGEFSVQDRFYQNEGNYNNNSATTSPSRAMAKMATSPVTMVTTPVSPASSSERIKIEPREPSTTSTANIPSSSSHDLTPLTDFPALGFKFLHDFAIMQQVVPVALGAGPGDAGTPTATSLSTMLVNPATMLGAGFTKGQLQSPYHQGPALTMAPTLPLTLSPAAAAHLIESVAANCNNNTIPTQRTHSSTGITANGSTDIGPCTALGSAGDMKVNHLSAAQHALPQTVVESSMTGITTSTA